MGLLGRGACVVFFWKTPIVLLPAVSEGGASQSHVNEALLSEHSWALASARINEAEL